ncbi:MAG TPA: T9SS type A sorting domain-containing protein [Arachidicoccus soli]|nr:T9SS type A sorting domain-containing protein [Arachidicoccus soli]HEU0228246.1 T9SS type A sorting domain-containing protein [Arachidicoccus soli]
MKKIFILIFVLTSLFGMYASGQSLPPGTCGIVYTYDAAGNRTKQEYVINNSAFANIVDSQKIARLNESVNVLKVDVLYPNPTTGYFAVRLVKQLQNDLVTITDVSGRVILQRKENGNLLHYNFAQEPAGVYTLNITEGQQSISMKIMKR